MKIKVKEIEKLLKNEYYKIKNFIGGADCIKDNVIENSGYTYLEDWRVPTNNELRAMYDIDNNTQIIGFSGNFYWSSTIFADSSSFAWGVYFSYGYYHNSNKTNSYFVRCVRVGQNNTLELAPSSVEKMTWFEAIEYAKNLKGIKKKYITVVKLDGLCYKKVETL
jgi:hypothetical protein